MAGETQYFDDNATRVLNLLQDTFGSQFHQYFDGEAEPSEDDMPCISVSTLSTIVDVSATGTDDLSETIMIILTRSLKDDADASYTQNTTEYVLRKQVMGQDPITGAFITESVMGALRTHLTLSSTTVQSNISIDFMPTQRGEINCREAFITLTTTRRVIVLPRD